MSTSCKLLLAILGSISLMLLDQEAAFAQFQCFDCHGTRSTADYRPLDATSRDVTTGGFQGNHQRHIAAPASPDACEVCHQGSAQYSNAHRDGMIKLRANINDSPLVARYRNTTTVFPQTHTPSLGTCTNVNCHFETTTPVWGSSAFSGTENCTKCHAFPPADGSHAVHDDSFGQGTSCGGCHADHATEGSPFAHATSAGKRGLILQGFAYSKTANTNYPNYLPSQTSSGNRNGTCSSINCHHGGDATWGGNGNHTATLGSGTITVFGANENNDHSAGASIDRNCADCHSTSLAAGHADQCFLCHSGANPLVNTLTGGWNKTCQQGSCHPSFHTSLEPNHFGVYAYHTSWVCDQCHDASASPWPGPGDDCSRCHGPSQTLAIFIDRHPPVYTIPPLAPTGISASAGNGQVTISWATGFATTSSLIRYGITSGNLSTIVEPATSAQTITGLVNGVTVYYQVGARNGVGTTWNNNIYNVTPVLPLPTAPTAISSTYGNGQVTISWTAGSGSTSSLITYGTTPGNLTTAVEPAASPQTITGLTNGTPLYYRVGARNAAGTTWSGEYGVTPIQPPLSPTDLTAPLTSYVSGSGSIFPMTFQWTGSVTPDGDATQYKAEVSSTSNFSTVAYSSTWQAGSSWNQSIPVGTWYWRVTARDISHILAVSAPSTAGSFSIIDRTPAATALTAQPTSYVIGSGSTASIDFQWSAVTPPDGDAIEYQIDLSDSSSFTTIPYQSSWQAAASWTQPLPVGTWHWRVKARDSMHSTASSISVSSSFAVVDRTPAVPTLIHNVGANANGANITFQWNTVASPDGDAVQFWVDVSPVSDFSAISYSTPAWQTAASWTQSLPVGTYYWRVRARDSVHTTALTNYSASDSFVIVSLHGSITYDSPGTYYWPTGAENVSSVSVEIIGGGGGGEGGGDGGSSSVSYGSFNAIAYGGNGDGNGGSGGGGAGNLNGQSIINGDSGTLDTENDSENPGGGGSPNGGGAWNNYGGGGGGTVTGSLSGAFSSGSQMTIIVGGGGGSWVGDLEGGSGSVTLTW